MLHSTGVGKITNKRISQPQHKPSYTYAVYNRQALALLQQIQPQLKSHKAARSALVLWDYIDVTPRNGKYTEELLLNRENFEKAFREIKPE